MEKCDTSICRLCLNTESLNNLYENDSDLGLIILINSCTSLKIYPNDGLPAAICNRCKKKIKIFSKFKENCLKVDYKLRTMAVDSLSPEIIVDCKNGNMGDFPTLGCIHDPSKELQDFYLPEQISYNKLYSDLKPTNNVSETEEKSNDKHMQCEICACTFDTNLSYKRHLSTHNRTVKLYECSICSKKFTRAENKVNHMRSHMGIRPFICEICGQTSTKRQDLFRHMKIHSSEKNHACSQCGRRFKRSGDLYSHIRTHTGVRPYKCKFCSKDYTSHGGLRKHYKTQCKIHNDIT